MRHLVLVACLVVATFEQPIGHSLDSSFIMRHTVSWCPSYYHHGSIRIEEQVVNGRTGATIGAPRSTYYPLQEKGDTAPAAPNSEPMP